MYCDVERVRKLCSRHTSASISKDQSHFHPCPDPGYRPQVGSCVFLPGEEQWETFLYLSGSVACWKEHGLLLLRRLTWTGGLGIASYWSKTMNKSLTSLRLSVLFCNVGIIYTNSLKLLCKLCKNAGEIIAPFLAVEYIIFPMEQEGRSVNHQGHMGQLFSPGLCLPRHLSGKGSIALSCSRTSARPDLIICGCKLAATLDELISSYRK